MKNLFLLMVLITTLAVPTSQTTAQDDTQIFYDGYHYLELPATWFATSSEDGSSAFLSTSEATFNAFLDNDNLNIETGEQLISILTLEATDFTSYADTLDNLETIFLNEIINDLQNSNIAKIDVFGEDITTQIVNDRPMALSFGASDDFEAILIMMQTAPSYFTFTTAYFSVGEREDYQEATLDRLSRLLYSPGVDEPYNDETTSFKYPSNWTLVVGGSEESYVLYLSEESYIFEDYQPNDYGIILSNVTDLVNRDDLLAYAEDLATDTTQDTFTVESMIIEIDDRQVYVAIRTDIDEGVDGGGAMIFHTSDGKLYSQLFGTSSQQTSHLILIGAQILVSLDDPETL